ncbi:hypothetical protein AGMMS50229_19530 [Campylobacterota bacterium]|nr:hypothetical protein AGMMS50229_19530 [Campylobacterota bacterium]
MNAGSLRDVDMIVWEMEKEISFFLPGKKNRSVIGQPACPAGREELLRTLVLRAMEIVLPAAGGKE